MEGRIKELEEKVLALEVKVGDLQGEVIKLKEEKSRLESVLSQHISNPSY